MALARHEDRLDSRMRPSHGGEGFGREQIRVRAAQRQHRDALETLEQVPERRQRRLQIDALEGAGQGRIVVRNEVPFSSFQVASAHDRHSSADSAVNWALISFFRISTASP